MVGKSLAEWLQWQETLNPAEIDLSLERIQELVVRLNIQPPQGRVFTVAGTNGKGSTSAVIAGVLRQGGLRVGVYSSPHLLKYNERIVIDGVPVSDADLVNAFERIESRREDIQLTYFEYGTLAAWLLFEEANCDVWVQEIGLGGRLDAVNAIDPDFGVITTIGLDHQDWLGDSIEAIAAEKAGIMRPGMPVFYGDAPVPENIRRIAAETGAHLNCLNDDFGFELREQGWSWRGAELKLSDLALPCPGSAAQLRNISVALAALEAFDANLLRGAKTDERLVGLLQLPGRFQVYQDSYNGHEWILDVAHNAQAADALKEALGQLTKRNTTVVLGMLADKNVTDFVGELTDIADQWVVCRLDPPRGLEAEPLAELVRSAGGRNVRIAENGPFEACAQAREITPTEGRILVCGSFRVVGPAIDWLGLY